MQEGRYKVLMYVFLALFVISAGLAGYFGLYFYYSNKAVNIYQDELKTTEMELENYNNKIQENSVYGTIKTITDTNLVIDIGEGKEQQIVISDDTKIQKIQENDAISGTYIFVDASKSDLSLDKQVWVIVDENNKDNAVLIKISTL